MDINKKFIVKKLDECVKIYEELSAVEDKVAEIFGTSVFDSKLFECMFTVFDKYIEELKTTVGDNGDWINWYIYETNCGKGTYSARAGNWKKDRVINSTSKLADLIIIDGASNVEE